MDPITAKLGIHAYKPTTHVAGAGQTQTRETLPEVTTPGETYTPDTTPVNATQSREIAQKTSSATMPQLVRMLVPSVVSEALGSVASVLRGDVRQSHFEHSQPHATAEQADATFQAAREKLLNPEQWQGLFPAPGIIGKGVNPKFEVHGADGSRKSGSPEQGDFLRISFPAVPGVANWVKVDEVSDQPDNVKVVVRPSHDPTSDRPDEIVHFFSDATTNTFQIAKGDDNRVTATVDGGNEMRNDTGGLIAQGMNKTTLAFMWAGGKKPLWRSFTQKILTPLEGGASATGAATALSASQGAQQPRFH